MQRAFETPLHEIGRLDEPDPGVHAVDRVAKWAVYPSSAGGLLVVVGPVRVCHHALGPPPLFAAHYAGICGACGEQRGASLSQVRVGRGSLECGQVAQKEQIDDVSGAVVARTGCRG